MTIDWSKIAVVDTETLGLDRDRHPIWEIAVITGPADIHEHCWQVEVRDIDFLRADPKALEITRFDDRYDPDTTLTAERSVDRLCELLDGRHLVGAIPSFDEERFRHLVSQHRDPNRPGATGRWPWHYHVIDIEAMAVGFLRRLDIPVELPWQSDWLGEMLGVEPTPPEERHTALGDARWVARMYERMMADPF